jgi:hypothetical protein
MQTDLESQVRDYAGWYVSMADPVGLDEAGRPVIRSSDEGLPVHVIARRGWRYAAGGAVVTIALVGGLIAVTRGLGAGGDEEQPRALGTLVPSEGCGIVPEGSIVESTSVTPWAAQRGPDVDNIARLPDGDVPEPLGLAAEMGLALGELPAAQLAITDGDGAVYAYFADAPIDGMTVAEFIRAGGIQVHVDPMTDDRGFAAYLLDAFGERAVSVAVGSYNGALVWADPNSDGTRTHNLYWSDGVNNYSLIADMVPDEIVDLGRSLVCSP